MRCPRWLWTLPLLAALLGLGLPSASAAPRAEAPDEGRVMSAHVTIAGPGVYRRFLAETGAPTGDVEATVAAAQRSAELLAALETEVLARQAPVVRGAKALGARVISRYTTAANGLLVHATPAQMEAIAALPGVLRVEPAPLIRPALRLSVPYTGATALAEELGYDGTGSVVAVIDTGVDYTHAHLGGPGSVDAFAAASAPGATETIDDEWEGVKLFPNDKVIGGWDFVGRYYNPPHTCPPDVEPPGCSSTPRPDPDPLDGGSHGTHVSGIVAGVAEGPLADGMAPGAKLLGLKLYGNGGGDEAADVLVDAIEWCAKVNLGTETRGTFPSPEEGGIDAINISLGEGQAQGSRLFDEAVEAAIDSGVTVVASAGNAGNRPFVLGAPSASPRILSVASAVPPQESMRITESWESETLEHPALEGTITVPLSEVGVLEAEVGWYGLACNDDEGQPPDPAQDVEEKIALIERGTCSFSEKIINAQDHGAIGVLLFTDDRGKTAMGGDGSGVLVPGAMIDRAPGLAMRDRLTSEIAVTVRMDPENTSLDLEGADAVSGFSSRGPSKNGALKPDITGPGSGILSTSRGSGTAGVSFSGTSMSGPHLAGAAAVLHQRSDEEGLDLGADDVAALLMNYARPVVWEGADRGTLVPVTRQGAGELDLLASGRGQLLVRTGDLASVNLGPRSLQAPFEETVTLRVRNLGDTDLRVRVEGALLYEDDRDRGLEIRAPEGPQLVAAGSSTSLEVGFAFAPARMRFWDLLGPAGASAAAVQQQELDGYLRLTIVGEDGQPVEDALSPSVPFYTLPRRASDLSAGFTPAEPGGTGGLLVRNASPFPGSVDIFHLPEIDGEPAPEDPDEPDVLYELDLRRVGARIVEATGPVSHTHELQVTTVTWERAAIPQVTRLEVYVDADLDGEIDHRIRESSAGDAMQVVYAPWDAAAGAPAATEQGDGASQRHDLHSRVRQISVPLEAIGLQQPAAIDYYVVHRGLNEDWLDVPDVDVAPDGADAPGGPRYRLDPDRASRLPVAWSVEGLEGEAEIPFAEGPGSVDPAWLLTYARDRLEDADAQLQVLDPSGPAPTVTPDGQETPEPSETPEGREERLWLPALLRGARE